MSREADAEDDAILSAYLDRELSHDDVARLTERLASDPALARRLEEMRSANLAVRRMFEAADELPLPRGVLDLLDEGDAERAKDERVARQVLQFPARGPRRFLQAPVALAASVALAVGLLAGGLFRGPAGPGAELAGIHYAGAIPETSELHQLLESGVSTEPQVLEDGVNGRLLLTFQSERGDYCRQLRLTADSGSLDGLACRRNGGWRMEAVSFGAAPSPESDYQAASPRSSPALNAAIEAQIGTNDPLGPEEEARLISKGWENSGN